MGSTVHQQLEDDEYRIIVQSPSFISDLEHILPVETDGPLSPSIRGITSDAYLIQSLAISSSSDHIAIESTNNNLEIHPDAAGLPGHCQPGLGVAFIPYNSFSGVVAPDDNISSVFDRLRLDEYAARVSTSRPSLPLLQLPTSPWHSDPSSPSQIYNHQESPYGSDFSPNSLMPTHHQGPDSSRDNEQWPIGSGRGQSLPDSSFHAPWRSRSSSVTSEEYHSHSGRGRGSSVSSEFSFEHIDPRFLSSPTSTTQSNLTKYSADNGSPVSISPHECSSSSHEPNSGRHTHVATRKIRIASERRRKRGARFFCEVPGCHGSFTAKHNLINHTNSHEGVRKFKCNFCEKRFVTNVVLKRHIRICRMRLSKE
ncbi:hypothetical protein DFH05DRAFT_1509489 [Lentinula detonsa]|uniref:C2H2-type domain-containing protein n=1 Tax=Lentinula detonsa TaxID=2804962 RepID=A0A9W8TUN7_9AGAR|nr:hypothetical protein DFH05DRAFT_1509489 [Lentinula detonsa]KAJ3988016.1 hypothetical protein F5890DRAFT_629050 [Lentinula detonsa]